MERLSHIIQHAVSIGKWRPIKLSRTGPQLSHLFFADDLILFVEAAKDQILTIMDCPNEFCSISGQNINFQKSNMFFSQDVQGVMLSGSPTLPRFLPQQLWIPILGIPLFMAVFIQVSISTYWIRLGKGLRDGRLSIFRLRDDAP